MEYAAFERRVLEMLFTTEMPISPAHMAYAAGVPVIEAERHLERMVEQRILTKECDLETGAVTYRYPQRALLPLADRPAPVDRTGHPSQLLAAMLSILLPGSGHMYTGRVSDGIGWMLAVFVGYVFLVLPGLVLHALCTVSAVRAAGSTLTPAPFRST
jgi:hypothetical protein